jgi:hypothetical protein
MLVYEDIVNIGEIVDHHCLSFLFIILLCILRKTNKENKTLPYHHIVIP